MWPSQVRSDLRAGLKARDQGDFELSAQFLHRALETARGLPEELLTPNPHLKLSGIAITLASVLRPSQAYTVYSEALASLQSYQEKLTSLERMRSVTLACKLGEMAEGTTDEERWLVWAVEEVLRTLRDANVSLEFGPGSDTELALPEWANAIDVGAPVQALGAYYARIGKVEYATPLYLTAISVLMPPKGKVPVENKCRAAELMNNLAELFTHSPNEVSLRQAEAWAQKAQAVIQSTAKEGPVDSCELALTAVLFNLGSLREMSNDFAGARTYFISALTQARRIGMKEGVQEAQVSLRRMDRMQRAEAVREAKNTSKNEG